MTETLVDEQPSTRWQRFTLRARALRPRHLGLRTRVLLMFSLGSLALSALLSMAAYSFTRSSLVNQRVTIAAADATLHASIVAEELTANPGSSDSALRRLTALSVEHPVVFSQNDWSAGSSLGFGQIPSALIKRVVTDNTAARMIVNIDNTLFIVTGVPRTDVNADYFEFISIDDVESTLRSVALSLLFAAMITTMFGVMLGWIVAGRAVRPLADAAQAAQLIAGGRLDTRLEVTDDPDLGLLANSFNDMAAALQTRVERDARFASDVSHELRSPLMTLAASAEVLQSNRAEMPERAQIALDLMVSDVTRFQGLVADLLEISRFDAGAVRLHREELIVAEFVRQAVAVSSAPDTPITVSDRGERLLINGDRRRLARVLANLIDNARFHGGGPVGVFVTEALGESEPIGHVWIAVEDDGPGVPVEERQLVFERFARGAVAGRRGASDGAGLGLALVDEHIRLHGGRVWVEDRADGEPGARFVIELPAEELL